jgi:hypothetical protein
MIFNSDPSRICLVSVLTLGVVMLTACQSSIPLNHHSQANTSFEASLESDPRITEFLKSFEQTPGNAARTTNEFVITETDLSGGVSNRQGEVTVALNRNNPDQAVTAIMNLPNSGDGNLLLATTHDAGETWFRQTLMTDPAATSIADPMLAWDAEGRVFLAQIPVLNGTIPLGIDVMRSLDGGLSWEPPVRISSAHNDDDKVAIAVDDQPDSPYFGFVYVAWKWPAGPVWFSRSMDHGETFSLPRQIDQKSVSGLDVTVAKDGTVIVAYNHGSLKPAIGGIYTQRSDNGGETFQSSKRVSATNAQWDVRPIAHCSVPGAFINASIDADRSGVEDSGRMLLTWVDYPDSAPVCANPCSNDCATVVRYSLSGDNGNSWTPALDLPQPPGTPPGSQFFQWSDIDQANGDMYISYKDTTGDPAHRRTDTLMVRSTDHGLSWSEPLSLSSGSGASTGWPGHYQGMAAQSGIVYVGWPDYRASGAGDFYIATAVRPFEQPAFFNRQLSGVWFNPTQSGHGWFLEVLQGGAGNAPDRLVALWFVHLDDRPVWLIGVGEIVDQQAELETFITDGGEFPPDFVGAEFIDWGTLLFSFESESAGNVIWESLLPEFGSGSIDIEKLASITETGNDCLSGSYYDPAQSGHGFVIEILDIGGFEQPLINWFTYIDGKQIWLTGLGEMEGDTLTAELSSYSEGQFPPLFDPLSVRTNPWGLISMVFNDNDHAEVSWAPVDDRFSAGSLNVERLTQLLGHECD